MSRHTEHTPADTTKRSRLRVVIAVMLAIILCAGGVAVGMNWNRWFGGEPDTASSTAVQTEGERWSGDEETYSGTKHADTIDIPGFESITFKEGVTKQAVNLYNPEANACYFRMTLRLEDGTELWQSKLVKPGDGLHEITLNQALDAGDYKNATLAYECFSLSDQTPLNGSNITLTINVVQ